MYAARRRQESVRGKFQFGKLCIGQQFQFFDNTLRQLPQGSFIGHQVALHQPQFVDAILSPAHFGYVERRTLFTGWAASRVSGVPWAYRCPWWYQ